MNRLISSKFTIEQLPEIAGQILAHAGNNKIFVLYGEMGAGKTTLVKELCAALGVTEAVTSPTFSIVNEYRGTAGKVYHFDFYRLKNQEEALDMGYEEYFYSGEYCFIEWPEKIPGLMPPQYTKLMLEVTGNGERQISVENLHG